MTVTTTPRLGLTRWSDDADTQNRTQFDAGNAALELLAAIFGQGARGSRPAPAKAGRVYFVTGDGTADNNGLLFYDNGTAWSTVGSALRLAKAVADAAADTPLKAKGAAAQTADLLQFLSSADAVLASVNAAGQPVDTAGAHVGPGAKISGPALDVAPLNTSGVAVVLRLLGSQTGDALQVQNSTGSVLAKFGATGLLSTPNGIAAGSAGTGQVALKLQLNAGQTADVLQVLDTDLSVRTSLPPNGGLFARAGTGIALKAQGAGGQPVAQLLNASAAELLSLSATGQLALASTAAQSLLLAGGAKAAGVLAVDGRVILGANTGTVGAPGTELTVQPTATTDVAVRAKAAVAQTADVFQVSDAADGQLAAIGPAGAVRSPNLTAAVAGHRDRDVPPYVEARANGVIPTLPTNMNTAVKFTTLVESTEAGMHDNVNGWLVFPAAGLVEFEAVVNWDDNAAGIRSLKIQDADPVAQAFADFAELAQKTGALSGPNRNSQTLVGKARVTTPGRLYRVMALQNSGSSIAYAGDHSTRFSIRWLQP